MTVKITPLHQADMVQLSEGVNVFERQILPFGKFNYQGVEFDINDKWADDAIKAFEDRAVAQTWFHLADENNSHNVDNRPDRYGGEVVRLKKTKSGLSGVYKLTDKASAIVRENPKLGVSARFRTNYEREADGKKWPIVIDQVLGTLNPKIINSDTWKAVTLSELAENETVEDSSDEEWQVPDDNKNGKTVKPDENVSVPKAELEELMSFVRSKRAEEDELAKLFDKKPADDKVTVGLSEEDQTKITTLSNQVRLSRQEVADARFEKDAESWKRAGVPPRLVELAKPVLSSYDEVNVVTLSEDGSTVTTDARSSLRQVLDELRGTVALSGETGHAQTTKEDDKLAKEEDDLLAAWDKE